MRVTRKGARPLGEVQRLWDAGMTSSSHQRSDDDRESLTSTTDMMARRAEGASADTSRRSRGTTPGEVATDDTFATRLAGRAVRFGSEEGAGTDQPDDRRQRPTGERWGQKGRVARVADFARWTEAIAATADDTASKTKRSRKRAVRAERRWAAAAVSDITGARELGSRDDDDDDDGDVGGVTGGGAEHNPFAKTVRHARSQGSGYRARGAESFGTEDADRRTSSKKLSAEMQRGSASDHGTTSSPGDESLRRSSPGEEVGRDKTARSGLTTRSRLGARSAGVAGVGSDRAEPAMQRKEAR